MHITTRSRKDARSRLAAIGLMAAMLTATACGGTSEPANSDASSAGDGAGSDGSIKIMVTETLSSPSMSFPQSEAGARAAAQAINEAGGVDGRELEILACNDGLDPNKAAACVQKGIDEGVVAFVGVLNMFTATLWPKLEAAGIPFIGLDGNSEDQVTNKMSYPLTAGVPGIYLAGGRLAVEHGGEKVALLLPDVPQAKFVGSYGATGVEAAGGEIVGEVPVINGAPDMSTTGAQIATAGADAAICTCNPGDAGRILKAARQQGWDGAFVTSNSAIYDSDIEDLGELATNLYTVGNMRSWVDPEVSLWVDEMAAFDPDVPTDSVSAHTWVSTHIIADLLKGVADPTPAALVEALDTAEELDMRGLTTNPNFLEDGPLPQAPRLTNIAVTLFETMDGVRSPASDGFVDAMIQ